MMMIGKPQAGEYAEYYERYIKLVNDDDILGTLSRQTVELREAAALVSSARERHRYGPGKWSIREIFGHLIDAERVFGYRLFCISRGEKRSLPGFDENEYVASSGFDERTLQSLVDELVLLRSANLTLMKSLDESQWNRSGVANDVPVSVRSIAFILAGHVKHHMAVLSERYA